jgi:hypothetical protein
VPPRHRASGRALVTQSRTELIGGDVD